MPRAIYLTHPEVNVDPNVAVPDWGLNDIGQTRVAALVARFSGGGWQVASSTERKALEMAWPLAACLGQAPVSIRHDLGENDRSSTGFLKDSAFQAAANAFFGASDVSYNGWERAVDAQARIVGAVQDLISDCSNDNLVICGHGGVGTLLYCALAGVPIDRQWDQKGGGHWFEFDTRTLTPENHWQPMETLVLN
ncbi:histidine phosphatase family protein [Shimia sp. MMG029]|uniref:histidine phosphatase family protein n=1 Tax=Shimia sp. MMG029 TaxID=3021978 RepID=UPI0022FE4834|nr:histidine phosphatase family protein [Shimia sp. MMG029]MDA5558361.1 histidine phosphatase family protein [Shimia sp. MMG029]